MFKQKGKQMEFEQFWSLYPKKVGKKDAQRHYSKLTAEDRKAIEATLPERVRTDLNWSEGKFIPNPATYLNQGRWDDDYPRMKSYGASLVNQKNVICEECGSHVKSQRHDDICLQGVHYFDGKIDGKPYMLCPKGGGVIWV